MNDSLNRRAHAQLMFEQREAHLGHLPGHILLDLARNEAAPREWRKAAVELLIDKKFPQASHADLVSFVTEIQAERTARQDVEAVVESAIEGEIHEAVSQGTIDGYKASFEHSGGAPSASVTTASLQAPDIIRNADALNDDALGAE